MIQFARIACIALGLASHGNGQEDGLLSAVGGKEFAGDEATELLQHRSNKNKRISSSIPRISLTFPRASIPHGHALIQMQGASKDYTWCFTTNETQSATEELAHGHEIIYHTVNGVAKSGNWYKIESDEGDLTPGTYCCEGEEPGQIGLDGDDVVGVNCTEQSTSLMEANVIIEASSSDTDSAVDQIAELAKRSPEGVALLVNSVQMYSSVQNKLADHKARDKVFRTGRRIPRGRAMRR